MLKVTTTAFVLNPDPVERAWIVAAMAPVVESIVELDDSPTVRAMLQNETPACLIACAEPEEQVVLELVRELRRRGSRLPAIVLGSHAAFRTAVDLARLDATAFLERPLSAFQLRAAVRKACKASAP